MNNGLHDRVARGGAVPRKLGGVPPRTTRVLGVAPPVRAAPVVVVEQTTSDASSPNIKTALGSPTRPESPPTSEMSVATVSSNTSEDSTELSCPICNETMMTLLQLNRHLDDEHISGKTRKGGPNEPGDGSKKKESRRKQKAVGTHGTTGSEPHISQSSHEEPPVSRKMLWATPQTEEKVTREHWRKLKPSSHETCSADNCGRVLTTKLGGSLNCRKCGRLYCPQHVEYQMKLSPASRHDPEKGYWCRVCEACYVKRPGYQDNSGVTTNLYHGFVRLRDEKLKMRNLERNRLEKRLAVLVRELTKLASESGVLTYSKMQKRKIIEHTVAVWEDDTQIDRCPICEHKFNYMLRKHHCRVCGKVVCGDLATDCSREVALSLIAEKLNLDMAASSTYGVRVCRDCKDLVFSKRNFHQEAVSNDIPPLLKQYRTLTRLKSSIQQALPKFQESLIYLNDPRIPPSHETMEEAAKVRRKLLQQFGQYDAQARKIAALHVASSTERYLQKQIYQSATQYLHENMLPLKALPKVLKHAPEDTPPPTKLSPEEIQALRDQLIVMQEQQFLVQNMISEAKSTRKFDELIPLEQSASDLQTEISALENQLGDYSIV